MQNWKYPKEWGVITCSIKKKNQQQQQQKNPKPTKSKHNNDDKKKAQTNKTRTFAMIRSS